MIWVREQQSYTEGPAGTVEHAIDDGHLGNVRLVERRLRNDLDRLTRCDGSEQVGRQDHLDPQGIDLENDVARITTDVLLRSLDLKPFEISV